MWAEYWSLRNGRLVWCDLRLTTRWLRVQAGDYYQVQASKAHSLIYVDCLIKHIA